jgi:hypothetical protein
VRAADADRLADVADQPVAHALELVVVNRAAVVQSLQWVGAVGALASLDRVGV